MSKNCESCHKADHHTEGLAFGLIPLHMKVGCVCFYFWISKYP